LGRKAVDWSQLCLDELAICNAAGQLLFYYKYGDPQLEGEKQSWDMETLSAACSI
jgi:hypothetical protein